MSLTITVTCEVCGLATRHDIPTAAALLNDGMLHDAQGVPLCPTCNPKTQQFAEIIYGPGNLSSTNHVLPMAARTVQHEAEDPARVQHGATPCTTHIIRYEHGGGRVWREKSPDDKDLVADFYDKQNREFYAIFTPGSMLGVGACRGGISQRSLDRHR